MVGKCKHSWNEGFSSFKFSFLMERSSKYVMSFSLEQPQKSSDFKLPKPLKMKSKTSKFMSVSMLSFNSKVFKFCEQSWRHFKSVTLVRFGILKMDSMDLPNPTAVNSWKSKYST